MRLTHKLVFVFKKVADLSMKALFWNWKKFTFWSVILEIW